MLLNSQIERALNDYNASVNGNTSDAKYNKRKLFVEEIVAKYAKIDGRCVYIVQIRHKL